MKNYNQKFKILDYALLFCILIFTFLILGAFSASAQTEEEKIAQLREQIAQLEQQAKQFKSSIAGEQAKADSLNKQIGLLKSQIAGLQNQIALTGKKIDKTKIEITGVENNIYDAQEKINSQKNSIAQLLLFLNRQDKESLVEILLKNRNIAAFLNQQRYTANLTTSLLGLISDFKQAKNDLENKKDDLQGKQKNLESLNHQQYAQKLALDQAKTSTSTLLTQTKGQEAEYKKILANIQIQESNFFNQLRELETHIIQGGLYIVHITAGSLPKKGTNLFQWPEEGYHITQGYGCTSYARCGSRRGAYGGAPHNGVDMASGFGSPIMTIGDGEIVANGKNDGWGNWVAIKHPSQYNLVSLYAHMSALSFLQVGTQIKAGDVIGYEGNTGEATGSHLHLSMYKDFFTYISDKKSGQLYFNYFEGTINPLDYLP